MLDVVLFLVSLALGGSRSLHADNKHYYLGQAIYVPDTNLLGSAPNGRQLFSCLPQYCMQNQSLHKSVRITDYYRDTETLYSTIATTSGLQANFETDFNFGFTLDVITKGISGEKRDASGSSLQLTEKSYILLLLKDCMLQRTPPRQFMDDFQSLNSRISQPWLTASWQEYKIFLENWGSHIITGVTLGSSIIGYSFAEETQKYTERDFTVKTCLYMANDPKQLNISACSNVTEEEKTNVESMTISSSLTITGGTVRTRTKLNHSCSAEHIEQFMREGQTEPDLIEYTLVPIWEYLQEKTVGTPDLAKAVNLEYFYNGFLNFGCPYSVSDKIELQKFDLTSQATSENPEYSCTIAPSGCHHDDDCHYHVGVWCHCAGNTCIHYSLTGTSDTGKRRLQAAPYHGSDWGWQGCAWKTWGSSCECKHENSDRKTIWSQSSKYALYLAFIQSPEQKKETAKTRNEL